MTSVSDNVFAFSLGMSTSVLVLSTAMADGFEMTSRSWNCAMTLSCSRKERSIVLTRKVLAIILYFYRIKITMKVCTYSASPTDTRLGSDLNNHGLKYRMMR